MNSTPHTWRFFRAGGFDQARLDTADDLLAIGELDQKLWVALSCPVHGIEFDARTLALVDGDGDGHVRAPELIAAVRWAGERLARPAVLAEELPGVPLAAIRDDDDEGAAIATAARELLADLGRDDGMIDVAATSAAQARQAERALVDWQAAGAVASPLGDATAAAHDALQAVADKIDDWFVRGRLAAFDERAAAALNPAEATLAALAGATLKVDADDIAALPLARVEAGAALPLAAGLNPAWAARMEAFRDQVAIPLLGARDALSAADWQAVRERMAPYAAWLAGRPDPAAAGAGVLELERLARYVRDLLRLANNYVAFRDFYARQGKATFQVGTLYLDGRACELCVAVSDAARHAALAGLARLYLAYCDCRRGDARMTVAAAFTAGDADQLMVGRNGVFYDRQGRDWDATIVRLVDHPISLRQAFWSPYRRLGRFIGEQVQKFATRKDAEAGDRLAAGAVTAGTPPPFDVGKFAGIFAAIGLALGALGTALASALGGLVALAWWQLPLVLLGVMLLVSGPAVLLAWLKLRSRNLGPLLDANGWAVNARARINIPFGRTLTQAAVLPADAERSLVDPYADRSMTWLWFALLAGLVIGAVAWLVWGGGA
ncbi:MAG: hypothetical protein PHS77_01620 [Gallionellaceae bacterium]|nr:hypothetical protein [Gallionellaceae bacterium]